MITLDDDGETVVVEIVEARLVHKHTGEVKRTLPISDDKATGTISNSDPLPRAMMARFGRTAAVHVVDHVEERLQAPREPGFDGRFAGQQSAARRGTGRRPRLPQPVRRRGRHEPGGRERARAAVRLGGRGRRLARDAGPAGGGHMNAGGGAPGFGAAPMAGLGPHDGLGGGLLDRAAITISPGKSPQTLAGPGSPNGRYRTQRRSRATTRGSCRSRVDTMTNDTKIILAGSGAYTRNPMEAMLMRIILAVFFTAVGVLVVASPADAQAVPTVPPTIDVTCHGYDEGATRAYNCIPVASQQSLLGTFVPPVGSECNGGSVAEFPPGRIVFQIRCNDGPPTEPTGPWSASGLGNESEISMPAGIKRLRIVSRYTGTSSSFRVSCQPTLRTDGFGYSIAIVSELVGSTGAALLRRVLFAHFTGVFDHGCALSGAFSGGRLQAGGPPDGPPAFFGCPTPPSRLAA